MFSEEDSNLGQGRETYRQGGRVFSEEDSNLGRVEKSVGREVESSVGREIECS